MKRIPSASRTVLPLSSRSKRHVSQRATRPAAHASQRNGRRSLLMVPTVPHPGIGKFLGIWGRTRTTSVFDPKANVSETRDEGEYKMG